MNERRDLVRSIALGHFAALAEGFQLQRTAEALRYAKRNQLGSLRLEPMELVRIERHDRSPRVAVGAVVTPSGVVPIPRESDVEEFRLAMQTAYPDRALLLAIDIDHLRRIDKAQWSTKWGSEALHGDAAPYWLKERNERDGSEMIPLTEVKLTRISPGQLAF
jgi:hypothetical protein